MEKGHNSQTAPLSFFRAEVVKLLDRASRSRVSFHERLALARLRDRVASGESLGALELPPLRYARGLLMALGWAAEAETTFDEAWRQECLAEFESWRRWYLRTLQP